LTRNLAGAFAVELDKQLLIGDDVGKPMGVINWTDVNSQSMGANGAALTTGYDPIIDAIQLILDDNGDIPTDAIMAPRTWAAFEKLKDGNGQSVERPASIQNLRFRPTTSVPVDDTQGSATDASKIILGGFSDLIVGMRTSFRVEVLKERYADNFQFGFLAYLRVDSAVVHPKQFGMVIGIIP
jgi:HK97 family phage major capsid protein